MERRRSSFHGTLAHMLRGALIIVAIAIALAILATVLRDDPQPDDSMALRPVTRLFSGIAMG